MTRKQPSSAILHVAFNESRSMTDWLSDPRCVVSKDTLRNRIRRGWGVERALTTPDRFVLAAAKPVKVPSVAPRSYPALVRVQLDEPQRVTNSSQREPLVLPRWNVRAGADQHLNYRSLR